MRGDLYPFQVFYGVLEDSCVTWLVFFQRSRWPHRGEISIRAPGPSPTRSWNPNRWSRNHESRSVDPPQSSETILFTPRCLCKLVAWETKYRYPLRFCFPSELISLCVFFSVVHCRLQFVPDDLKDDKYWARRRKNNMAAKRSRDARRMKENQIALRAGFLEKEVNLPTPLKLKTRAFRRNSKFIFCFPL